MGSAVAERVLIDSGPLVALGSVRDAEHRRCKEAIKQLRAPLFTCLPVLTEVAWLLRHHPAAFEHLLEWFGDGLLKLLTIDERDLPELAKLLNRYRKQRVQLADACLVHLAFREDIRAIFTLDRRDFSWFRDRRNRPLRLIPDASAS